jgi:hypothetical protein
VQRKDSTFILGDVVARDQQSELLCAEELLLFCQSVSLTDETWPGPGLATCLVGAVISELVHRGRVVVRRDPDLQDDTIVVVDRQRTEDELLDDAVEVLCARQAAPSGAHPPVSLSGRAFGGPARRRLRTRRRVCRRDILSWWNGYWSLAEFPHLAPTLICQLLTLHERLNPVMDRVRKRLCARGLLLLSDDDVFEAFADDHWRHGVVTGTMSVRLRARWRQALLDEAHERDDQSGYIVALCAEREVVWLREGLCDDGSERVRAYDRHAVGYANGALAAAVGLIVAEWEKQFDCGE